MSAAVDSCAIALGRARRLHEERPDDPARYTAFLEAQVRYQSALLAEERRLRAADQALARALGRKLRVRRATAERLLDTISAMRRGLHRRHARPAPDGQMALFEAAT